MEETAGFVQSASDGASVSAFLDRLFDPIFSLFIFTTIFLPSGSIHHVNLKYPLYLLMLPLAVRRFFQRNPSNTAMLATMLAVPAVLSLWVLEGVVNGFAAREVVRQYMDIMLVLLMCWLAFLFSDGREEGRVRFLRLVVNCEATTCLLKIGIVIYAGARGVPVVSVVRDISDAFGVELMTMDLGAVFGRIQFVSDALIPICVFIVVRYRDRLKLGYWRALASILLLLLSVVFSFSRYFWAYTAVAFVVGLLLGKKDRFKAVLVALLGLLVLASLPTLSGLYELRFSDDVAGSSDALRTGQSEALQQFFLDAPLLGHGLGSYTTQLIRSDEGRHSYEMELLALSGQTGIMGMMFFLVLLGWYYRRLLIKGPLPLRDRLGLGMLLIVWLAAGLYNPLLESPVASLTYASLAALSGLKREGPDRSAASGPTVGDS